MTSIFLRELRSWASIDDWNAAPSSTSRMNLLCPRALHHQYRHSRAVRNRRQAPDAILSGWGRLRSSRCGGCSPYGVLREMTQGHVFDHALAQRADGSSVMARTPVSREVLNPVISRQDEPSRYPPPTPPSCWNPYRVRQ